MYAADWTKECPIAITVCDRVGTIIHMNPRSVDIFANDGGLALIGQNVLDCHPEPARTKTRILLEQQRSNFYTIEKAGRKKMICQIPWYQAGAFAGLVELSFEIPRDLPHFVRDAASDNPDRHSGLTSGDSHFQSGEMFEADWSTECPIKLLILDRDGRILRMNTHAAELYAADGGLKLVGRNIYDCHPEWAAAKLREIVECDQPTLYTTERAGVQGDDCAGSLVSQWRPRRTRPPFFRNPAATAAFRARRCPGLGVTSP